MLLKKIGFIGLGLMGFPMAKHLLDAGYDVFTTGHSNSKEAVERIDTFKSIGGKVSLNIIDVVKDVDIIISILPTDKEVREVFLDTEMLSAISKETVIIEMTSCSSSTILDVEDYYSEKGISILDAPVSGGVIGAQNGTLTIYGSGDEIVFERVKDVFNSFATNIYYIGSLGTGKALKSINQMMNAINTMATIEGLIIAKEQGINLDIMYEVIKQSSGKSNAFENKFYKIINQDYKPGFKLSLMRKDIKIALDSAKNDLLPLTKLTYDLFLEGEEFDDLDYTSVNKLYNK